jgi:hypothetical protein
MAKGLTSIPLGEQGEDDRSMGALSERRGGDGHESRFERLAEPLPLYELVADRFQRVQAKLPVRLPMRLKDKPFTETITGAQISQTGSTTVSVWSDKNSVEGDGAGVVAITLNGNEATGSGTQYWASGAAKFTETFTLGGPGRRRHDSLHGEWQVHRRDGRPQEREVQLHLRRLGESDDHGLHQQRHRNSDALSDTPHERKDIPMNRLGCCCRDCGPPCRARTSSDGIRVVEAEAGLSAAELRETVRHVAPLGGEVARPATST